MNTVYSRATSFDEEEFEDELVVMEVETQAVVTLNAAGRIVWESLEDGASVEELEKLFQQAFPEAAADKPRRDIQTVIDTLLEAGLAFKDTDEH